jgi:hypothetical protein
LDPVAVGTFECDALVAYYRREWMRFLAGILGMIRGGFGLPRWDALLAAWWVLRANWAWAPLVGSRPDRSQEYMIRFYARIARRRAAPFDPVRAAELELRWWTAHRFPHLSPEGDESAGKGAARQALCTLYSYVFALPVAAVREAAELRVDAFDVSDEWTRSERNRGNPLVASERSLLISSYTALRSALAAAATAQ